MHRTENKYNRLIKTEVTDVSSPREGSLLCPGKCLQQELHEVNREEREETSQPRQRHMAMSSSQSHKLFSSTFSGNTFSVFLAYIF